MRLIFFVVFVLITGFGQAQQFTSSNLPIVIINTNGLEIPDDPKITAHMSIIYNGEGVENHVNDSVYHYEGNIQIEIRGSSSQMFPKKQYAIELKTQTGEDHDTTLLGLPSEEDWILFAPYNDKSLMRDVLAYKLGNELGRYAPRTRYCEVILNDEYKGVYVLIEKIKRDIRRVDIKSMDVTDVAGDDITGGYIVKIDKATGTTGSGWRSRYPPATNPNKYIEFFLEYPDVESANIQQRQYIQRFIDEFETVLNSKGYKDPVDGYARFIDVDSFIDYLIMNEITKNIDGYRLSTYLHKQHISRGGKLVMGPIWDYNLGFGNANYCITGSPTGFAFNFNTACPEDHWQVPFWWRRLLKDRKFAQRLQERWSNIRSDAFSTEAIHNDIDSIARLLSDGPQQRNFERWNVLGMWVWPNLYVGATYEEEVDWLKNWVTERMVWLDEEMEGIVTGSTDLLNAQQVSISPNPFQQSFVCTYTLLRGAKVDIELFDSFGLLKQSMVFKHSKEGVFQYRSGETLSSGLYICRFTVNGRIEKSIKFVKE